MKTKPVNKIYWLFQNYLKEIDSEQFDEWYEYEEIRHVRSMFMLTQGFSAFHEVLKDKIIRTDFYWGCDALKDDFNSFLSAMKDLYGWRE